MKLRLAYYGDPILRKKAAAITEITPAIKQLVEDMIDTMQATNGIGSAAPQVHQSITLFIISPPFQKEDKMWGQLPVRVFINPKILKHNEETIVIQEGCLSIPGIRGDVTRPISLTVRATNLEGEEFEEAFEGWP